jgi:lipopolysaccharide transport system permease protein
MKINRPISKSVQKLAKSFISLGRDIIAVPFYMLWQYRSILYQTTINDIKTRHAGSVLGVFWLLIYPLLFLGTYAIVYIYI